MNCHQIDELLDRRWGRPGEMAPREAAEHLERCERCRSLWQLAQNQVSDSAVPAAVQATIERAVLGSLEPVRPAPGPGRFLLDFLAAFLLVIVVGVWLTGVRAPRVMSGWQFAALSAVLTAGVLAAAASLSRQVLPGVRLHVNPGAVVVGVVAAMVSAGALLFPWQRETRLWWWGPACASYGMLWSLPATGLLWLLMRRLLILSPARTGATAGLLAGLAGATVIHFGCASASAPHLAFWHAAVPVSSALAGFFFGAWQERRV